MGEWKTSFLFLFFRKEKQVGYPQVETVIEWCQDCNKAAASGTGTLKQKSPVQTKLQFHTQALHFARATNLQPSSKDLIFPWLSW